MEQLELARVWPGSGKKTVADNDVNELNERQFVVQQSTQSTEIKKLSLFIVVCLEFTRVSHNSGTSNMVIIMHG